jgi:lipopolysaccharide assembly protein A
MTAEPQPVPTPSQADAPLPRATYGGAEPAVPDVQVPAETPPPAETYPPVQETPPPAAAPPPVTEQPPLRIKRTRTSGIWVSVGFFAVILLLLLIFILQNGAKVSVNYMGAHGHLPLGVALLLSAVCGVLLVVLAGAARISQIRTTARRHRRADSRRAKAQAKAASR